MARALQTVTRSMQTIGCVCLPPIRPICCGACGSRSKEQSGYYYGLVNEGLWPLCHIAFVRPTFREEDWAQYRKVNERFADVVLEEATCDDPIVLVQDYHFAVLRRMIRNRLPKATIILFGISSGPAPRLSNLSLATGNHRRSIGQHYPWIPHAIPLQQFSRSCGPFHGEPH
jgi:hypothetical protein